MPLEVPSETAREGRAFDEVAREALRAADEVIQGANHSGLPIPPSAMVKDPLLSIEDLLREEHADLALSLPHAPSTEVSPVRAQTQTSPWSSTELLLSTAEAPTLWVSANSDCPYCYSSN